MFKLLLAFAVSASPVYAQAQLPAIANQAQGHVGIACSLPNTPLSCNLHAQAQLPMQSVYKLPIALVALHAVEQNKLQLDQPISFRPADIWSRSTNSPLRDAHPQANTTIPLRELLRYAVEQSDNIACDMLIRLLGGGTQIEATLNQFGLPNIHIRSTEQQVDRNSRLQYANTASPAALLTLLTRLRDRSPLTPAHTQLLLGWMTTSPTGPHRIKGLLPPGTPVAHKTGTGNSDPSPVNAVNDIGLITLPDGRRLALAVLIADAHAPLATREHVIAQVARTLYTEAEKSTPSTSLK